MAYSDAEIDVKIVDLQSQINLKAASQELSDSSGITSTQLNLLTNRVTLLEQYVQQLQALISSISAQIAAL